MLKSPTPSVRDNVPLLQGHETLKNMHSEDYFGRNQNMAFLGQCHPNKDKSFNRKDKQNQGGFSSKGRGFVQTGSQPSQGDGLTPSSK